MSAFLSLQVMAELIDCSMNRTYGFEGEAKHKHGEQTFKVRCYRALVDKITDFLKLCSYSPTFSLVVRCFVPCMIFFC